jgi:hypothetical protein
MTLNLEPKTIRFLPGQLEFMEKHLGEHKDIVALVRAAVAEYYAARGEDYPSPEIEIKRGGARNNYPRQRIADLQKAVGAIGTIEFADNGNGKRYWLRMPEGGLIDLGKTYLTARNTIDRDVLKLHR